MQALCHGCLRLFGYESREQRIRFQTHCSRCTVPAQVLPRQNVQEPPVQRRPETTGHDQVQTPAQHQGIQPQGQGAQQNRIYPEVPKDTNPNRLMTHIQQPVQGRPMIAAQAAFRPHNPQQGSQPLQRPAQTPLGLPETSQHVQQQPHVPQLGQAQQPLTAQSRQQNPRQQIQPQPHVPQQGPTRQPLSAQAVSQPQNSRQQLQPRPQAPQQGPARQSQAVTQPQNPRQQLQPRPQAPQQGPARQAQAVTQPQNPRQQLQPRPQAPQQGPARQAQAVTQPQNTRQQLQPRPQAPQQGLARQAQAVTQPQNPRQQLQPRPQAPQQGPALQPLTTQTGIRRPNPSQHDQPQAQASSRQHMSMTPGIRQPLPEQQTQHTLRQQPIPATEIDIGVSQIMDDEEMVLEDIEELDESLNVADISMVSVGDIPDERSDRDQNQSQCHFCKQKFTRAYDMRRHQQVCPLREIDSRVRAKKLTIIPRHSALYDKLSKSSPLETITICLEMGYCLPEIFPPIFGQVGVNKPESYNNFGNTDPEEFLTRALKEKIRSGRGNELQLPLQYSFRTREKQGLQAPWTHPSPSSRKLNCRLVGDRQFIDLKITFEQLQQLTLPAFDTEGLLLYQQYTTEQGYPCNPHKYPKEAIENGNPWRHPWLYKAEEIKNEIGATAREFWLFVDFINNTEELQEDSGLSIPAMVFLWRIYTRQAYDFRSIAANFGLPNEKVAGRIFWKVNMTVYKNAFEIPKLWINPNVEGKPISSLRFQI